MFRRLSKNYQDIQNNYFPWNRRFSKKAKKAAIIFLNEIISSSPLKAISKLISITYKINWLMSCYFLSLLKNGVSTANYKQPNLFRI